MAIVLDLNFIKKEVGISHFVKLEGWPCLAHFTLKKFCGWTIYDQVSPPAIVYHLSLSNRSWRNFKSSEKEKQLVAISSQFCMLFCAKVYPSSKACKRKSFSACKYSYFVSCYLFSFSFWCNFWPEWSCADCQKQTWDLISRRCHGPDKILEGSCRWICDVPPWSTSVSWPWFFGKTTKDSSLLINVKDYMNCRSPRGMLAGYLVPFAFASFSTNMIVR